MKTLAIRLDDEFHTRLTMLSKLCGITVTDTIRAALENHVNTLASDPSITAKADALTAEINKEAEQQREALASLFDTSTNEGTAKAARGRTSAKGSSQSGA